jgi:hypothetical protein
MLIFGYPLSDYCLSANQVNQHGQDHYKLLTPYIPEPDTDFLFLSGYKLYTGSAR